MPILGRRRCSAPHARRDRGAIGRRGSRPRGTAAAERVENNCWHDLLVCAQTIDEARRFISLVASLGMQQANAQDVLEEIAAMLDAMAPDTFED